MDVVTGNKTQNEGGEPSCFGDPRKVCPRDDEGVIQPQPECIGCARVRPCLQAALKKEGVLKDHPRESQTETRIGRFLKRWSDQKLARSESR
ncbi:MAG: hypothetical protein SWC40_08270 [Thermodesulfobacteriota bacterium]|nr:hypothetical protein [Thermodesulfobacteriota bacterium]